MRRDYLEAVRLLGILDILAPFDPHIAGTPPLGIDVDSSDIDILVHAQQAQVLAAMLWQKFSALGNFSMHQWINRGRPLIASFHAFDWDFEIFGADVPVHLQAGWRHFEAERRLLRLGGHVFRDKVMEARNAGLKTEPAFAKVLGLPGNHWSAMLDLAEASDDELAALIARQGI